jgi:hypothetical protein
MFFRSKGQGPETNWLQLEVAFYTLGTHPLNPLLPTGDYLVVYFYSTPVETFTVTVGGEGSIAALRALVASSQYIEMPTLNFDIFDPRTTEDDTLVDLSPGGVTSFSLSYLRGGSGAPTDASGLAGIRTGPERTIIILATSENADGSPGTPPWHRRVRQWTGSQWVTYANLVQGACPYVGTS